MGCKKIIELTIHPKDAKKVLHPEWGEGRLINKANGRLVKVEDRTSWVQSLNKITVAYDIPKKVIDRAEPWRNRKVSSVKEVLDFEKFYEQYRRCPSLDEALIEFSPEDSPEVRKRLCRTIEGYLKTPNNKLFRGNANVVGYLIYNRRIGELGWDYLWVDINREGKWEYYHEPRFLDRGEKRLMCEVKSFKVS